MGRELKRVPLDFDYPLNKVWHGYLNPFKCDECWKCGGTGYSDKANELKEAWYDWDEQNYRTNPFNPKLRYNVKSWSNNIDQDDVQALLDAGRLWDFTRVPITEEHKEIVRKKIENGGNSWLPFENGYVPTAKEVNEWNIRGMGHDSLNSNICILAKAKRLGYETYCSKCGGEGVQFQSPQIRELHENWEPFDPPEGTGFQLWGTTTEGEPRSPVFNTLDELCKYLEDSKASTFARFTATAEEWKAMLDHGHVCHKEGNVVFF